MLFGALSGTAAVLLWAHFALSDTQKASLVAAEASYPLAGARPVALVSGREHRQRSSVDAQGPAATEVDALPDTQAVAIGGGTSSFVTVQVIDGTTRAPVPRARVAQLLRSFDWYALTDEEQVRVHRFGCDDFALHSHFGVEHVADEAGELRVAHEEELYLACEEAGCFGSLSLDARAIASAAKITLELWPDISPRVRVTGAGGQPLAGCEIGLRPIWTRHEPGQERQESRHVYSRASTDASGLAVLHHLQEWLRWYDTKGMPDQVGIRLLIAGVTEDATQFDPLRPPEATIDLTAPPLGRIEVRLRDARGQPVARYDDLWVALADPSGRREGHWVGCPAGPGAMQMLHVALGHRFTTGSFSAHEVEALTFNGPTEPDQLVSAELLVAHRCSLIARLVDEQLVPVGRLQLSVRMGYGDDSDEYEVICEEDGRFALYLRNWMLEEDEEVDNLVVQVTRRDENTERMAILAGGLRLEQGINDLGDLILREAPLLVAGVVLVDGVPSRVPFRIEVESESDGWRDVGTAAISTPAPGEFTVRGLAGAGAHRLSANSAGCLSAPPVPFTPGQTDLTIELQRGGSLTAHFTFDAPGLLNNLFLELVADSGQVSLVVPERNVARRARASDPVTADVTWLELEAGTYELRVRTLGADSTLLSHGGLCVPRGARCKDPRLASIDLRGRLRAVEVRFVDERNVRLEGSIHGLVWSDNGIAAQGVEVRGDSVRLVVAGTPSVQVAIDGYSVVTIPALDRDQVVALRSWPRVRVAMPAVTLPDGIELCLSNVDWSVPANRIPLHVGDRHVWLDHYVEPPFPSCFFGPAKEHAFGANEAGELGLRAQLFIDNGVQEFYGFGPTRIGVSDGRTEAVPIVVNLEALTRAIEERSR